MPPHLFRRLILPVFCALTLQVIAAGDHAMTSEELMETAIAEYQRGDYRDAEEDFSEFIRRNPDHAGAHFNRALTRFQLNKFAEAEADLDVCLSLEPRSAGAFELRASARLQRGNVGGALADAGAGLRIEDAPGLRAVRGRALTAKRDYVAAIADLEIALQADESDDEARFARAECYLGLGKVKEAKQDFTLVADRHPENLLVAEKLGDASFRDLDFAAAAAAFEKAANAGPTGSTGLRKLGYARYALGDFAGAIEMLQRSQDRDGEVSPWAVAMTDLAWKRANREGESPLAGKLDRVQDPWGKAVCEMLLQGVSEEKLIEEANAAEDPNARSGRLCEAYFYIGSRRLLAGDKIAARAMFAQAVATDRSTFIEHTLARAELARM